MFDMVDSRILGGRDPLQDLLLPILLALLRLGCHFFGHPSEGFVDNVHPVSVCSRRITLCEN